MSKVLADTSVWVDFLNNRDLPHVQTLQYHLSNSIVCSCPPVVQEVLQGINKDIEYNNVKDAILTLEIFVADPLKAAVESAEIYRYLRKRGITIRKPNDCLIAWYAIQNQVKLFHVDSDFRLIANHTSLELL